MHKKERHLPVLNDDCILDLISIVICYISLTVVKKRRRLLQAFPGGLSTPLKKAQAQTDVLGQKATEVFSNTLGSCFWVSISPWERERNHAVLCWIYFSGNVFGYRSSVGDIR